MKFSFIHPFGFRVVNASVFLRVSMNLRQHLLVTPHSKLQCRHTHRSAAMFAESYRLLRVNQAKEIVVVYA